MTDATCKKILAIRARAGNTCATCPTCTRTAAGPFRRLDDRGAVVAGCVDATHAGHLYGASLEWHNRTQAKQIRKAELTRLLAL